MHNDSVSILSAACATQLFEGFSREETALVIEALNGKAVSYKKGEVLFTSLNTPPKFGMSLILSGMTQLVCFDEKGLRYIIDYSFAGSIIGYTGTMTNRYLINSSVVAGRDCTVITLVSPDKASLPSDLKDRLIHNLLKIVSDKYARLLQKGDITTKHFVRDKILTYLSYESQLRGGATSFDIPLSRQELADYICVDRTTLSTELTALKKEGRISTRRGHFELHEPLT